MIEPRFCYRVKAEAGMAYDNEGNNVPCYLQMEFKGGKPIDENIYKSIHKKLKSEMRSQVGIQDKYLECITQEEYDENQEEDDNL